MGLYLGVDACAHIEVPWGEYVKCAEALGLPAPIKILEYQLDLGVCNGAPHFDRAQLPRPQSAPRALPSAPARGDAPAASSHYGNPQAGGCLPDEEAVTVDQISGNICAASCNDAAGKYCPADKPSGTKALGACLLLSEGKSEPDTCALICRADADCPQRATCKADGGVSFCTYDDYFPCDDGVNDDESTCPADAPVCAGGQACETLDAPVQCDTADVPISASEACPGDAPYCTADGCAAPQRGLYGARPLATAFARVHDGGSAGGRGGGGARVVTSRRR